MLEPLPTPPHWRVVPIVPVGVSIPIAPAEPDVEPPAAELTTKERLEQLRDRLTDAVERASVRDLAPLAGRLQRVLADLEALTPTERRSDLDDLLGNDDELAPRRAARR